MQQLSGMDASFVYLETGTTPMHVGSVAIYDPSTAPDGKVTFKGILAAVESRLQLARAFRQRLVRVPFDLDHPYWIEDADFDLEFHVRHIALPKPGDWRQLMIQVARLDSRHLDLSRPLWEMYVVEGLDNVPNVPAGSFALVQKTHHAAVDGVSGVEMITAIHDLSPEGRTDIPRSEWSPEGVPAPWQLLMRASANNAARPMHFARVLGRTMPAFSRVQSQLRRRQLKLPSMSAPRTRFNGNVTSHRVVEGRRFSLADARKAKSAVEGATINDLVLSVVGGALRAYLDAKGELPNESLSAMAPISVRSEDQKGTAGNQVSGMVVSLASNVADPLDRLVAVRQSTHQSKEFSQAVGARTLSDYSQFIPGGLAGLAARTASRFSVAQRANPVVNTTVTNVPGPREPLYFAGARMVTLVGMGPVTDGMGLIHPITSYCDELIIAATSCREMMPDPGFYAECIEGAWNDLMKASS